MRVDALRRLSRDQLYIEVWLRPIGHIARDWNINSARLRTACKELCLPIPAAGHWAIARDGNMPQAPTLPAYDGVSSVILDSKPRASLVKWMKLGDTPAAPKQERKIVAPTTAASTAQPRYVPLSVWATAVFGEYSPHKNTLLRWVHEGRIQPQLKKIGRLWWVTPDAEYVGD